MRITSRAAVPIAFAVGPLVLLAGCGDAGTTDAGGTLGDIQPSSYVVREPATTTTTTTVPDGTADAGDGTAAGEQQYTVQRGDSVFGIAEDFDVEPNVLANYNKWAEGVQHSLQPGDTVLIPPGGRIPGSSGDSGDSGGTGDTGDDTADGTGSGDDTAESDGDGCTYTIVQDDNPSKVANMFDITVDELYAANPDDVMSSFLVGAVLQIPPGGDC